MSNTFDSEQETPEYSTLATIAENLVYRLPGCTDLMIRKTMQDVYREFCRETRCLTGVNVLGLDPGVWCVSPSPIHSGCVIDSIDEVYVDRKLNSPRDYVLMDNSVVLNGRFIIPETVAHDRPDVPRPDHIRVNRNITIRFTEIPSLGCETIPSWFADKYCEAIVSGVLSRLCSMSGRAWSDPSVAASESIRYNNFKNEARIRVEGEGRSPFGNGCIDAVDTSQML